MTQMVPLSVLNECLARVAKVESDLFEKWANVDKETTGKSPAVEASLLAQAEGILVAQGMIEYVLDNIQRDMSDLGIQVDFPRSPCM